MKQSASVRGAVFFLAILLASCSSKPNGGSNTFSPDSGGIKLSSSLNCGETSSCGDNVEQDFSFTGAQQNGSNTTLQQSSEKSATSNTAPTASTTPNVAAAPEPTTPNVAAAPDPTAPNPTAPEPATTTDPTTPEPAPRFGPDTKPAFEVDTTPGDSISFERLIPAIVTPKLGETIEFSYTVSNSGIGKVSSVEVNDSTAGKTSCGSGPLPAGSFHVCKKQYVVRQEDFEAGAIVSKAFATAIANGKKVTSPSQTAKIALIQTPMIALKATTKLQGTTAVRGSGISYVFAVSNEGTLMIDKLVVGAEQFKGITCAATKVAPANTVLCKATEPLTQDFVDAGIRTSSVTALGVTAFGEIRASTTVKTTIPRTPQMSVATGPPPPKTWVAGDEVKATFVITNTGNVSLRQVSTKEEGFFCSDNSPKPTAKSVCTASRSLDQSDIDSGFYEWTATITATSPDEKRVTLAPTKLRVALPWVAKISVSKKILPEFGPYNIGQEFSQSYAITNLGNVSLHGLAVVDPSAAGVVCPTEALRPGNQLICQLSRSITEADLAAGSLTSTVKASALPPKGATVTAEQSFSAKLPSPPSSVSPPAAADG